MSEGDAPDIPIGVVSYYGKLDVQSAFVTGITTLGMLSGAPDNAPAGGFVRHGGSDLGSPAGVSGGLGG